MVTTDHGLDPGLSLTTRIGALDRKTLKYTKSKSDDLKDAEEVEVKDIDIIQSSAAMDGVATQEGGTRAWLTVLGGVLIQFTGFGYTNAFGVFQDYYSRIFLTTSTSSQISWIGSVQACLLMSLGLISGRLFDKGYFYHLVCAGVFLIIFSMFMLSLAKPEAYYQVLLAQGIGLGLGTGILFVPSLAVVSQHFHTPHKRALAMGIVSSGSSLGGVLHPIMLNHLFHGSIGYANGVRVSGALLGGLLLISLGVMRTGDLPASKTINMGISIRKFSKDSAYICVLIAMFLMPVGFVFPIFYIQFDAVRRGIDTTIALYIIAILNAASMFGRIVPGLLSRSLGVANMQIMATALVAISIFGLLGVKDAGAFIAFAIAFGFASGAFLTLQSPLLSMLADTPGEVGARIGIGFTLQGFGTLVGVPVAGALLTSQFIWWRPIIFSGVFCAVGCLFFLLFRIKHGRNVRQRSWVL